MHYERAPCFERSRPVVAPLRSAAGPPDSGWLTRVPKEAGPEQWHFNLGGKVDVETNELPPKEATHMSRDVKYIGKYRNGRAQGSHGDRGPKWERGPGDGIHRRNQGQ